MSSMKALFAMSIHKCVYMWTFVRGYVVTGTWPCRFKPVFHHKRMASFGTHLLDHQPAMHPSLTETLAFDRCAA